MGNSSHIPGADTLPILSRPTSFVERLRYSDLFSKEQPVEVELGAGDGSFILEWAARHRERNFIAVERLLGRLRKIEKRGRRASLTNLRGVRVEISYFTQYLLPPGSVSAFHIYFPDPWPKLRHRGNRLIQAPFVEVMRATLVPGGVVYLRTDDVDYFTQMLAVFKENPRFEPVPTSSELAEVRTDFERHFNEQGIPTNRAAYRRVE